MGHVWASWALLLGVGAADWIAWKGNESQGAPSTGAWRRVPRSERFEAFAWEGPNPKQAVNGYRYFFKDATKYTLGNATNATELVVWQPFPEDDPDSAVGANIRAALFNLYHEQLDKFKVTLHNVGWDGVAKNSICTSNAPCPNVILLGSSQLSERVVADRVKPLNHFMEEYLRANLARMQDDFPGVSYYQYFYEAKWMGIPFLSDVRLIAFNKTTLFNLNISFPPPYNTRRQEWTWQDLLDDACEATERLNGTAGLLANSDFDEDFKFFTLMVQSGGGSLYQQEGEGDDQSLRCSINSPVGVNVLKNFWKPIITRKCMMGHNGGPFWAGVSPPSEALKDLLQMKSLNVVHPPNMTSFSNYIYTDPNRPQGHIDAYVWSSGFDERVTVGDCRKQWWPISYSKWSPHCKLGRAQMPMGNLSECKQAMLEYEMDTLIFEGGTCELLTCPTQEATVSLLPGTALAVKASKRQVFSTWCTEVLYATMPENHTFLGGSGLIIPKKAGDRHNCHSLDVTEDEICLREKEGWKMILELSDTDKPFMKQANLLKQQSVPPPRRSLAEAIQAQSKLWYPVVTAMKNGIPSQYPNTPIPESADIEEMKPVRLAMLETIYGNVPEETSLGRACEILDELVRPCNASRWETDVRCLNPIDGLAGCEAGSHLESDQLGIIRCRPCESGTYLPDRSVDQTCELCPVGRYAAKRGSGNCSVCPLGLVAQSPGQAACFNCSAGQMPESSARCRECPKGTYQEGFQCVDCPLGYTSPMTSPNENYCFQKASLIWLNFLLVLDVCALLLLLPSFFGKPVAVHDIYLDEGKLVLKTWGSHQVHRWAPLPVKIRLTHTHHYLLEEKNVFRVKWRDPDELYLLQDQGEHISKDINTSRGHMWILPRCSLWASATCGIPSLIVLVFLLVILALCLYWAILNGIGEAKHLPWSLSIALLGALGVLVVHYWVWRNQVLSTPLRRRQGSFKQRLLKANPNPQPTERGPDRAITAEQIGDLFEYFRDFIRRRDMHYVTNNLVLPFTKPYRLSYAEVAGPSRASWFVSHCWSNTFEDFFHSLRNMAQGKACCEWRKVTFWICSFSNNQFKVQEELGDGDPLKSSFYLALQSPECHGTAMVLDNDCVPLQRSWCLFELLQTRYVAPRLKSGYEGLLLCTPSGVLQWGNAHVDTVVRLAEKVGEIRLENAEASRVEDKIMIDACVIETVPGGFAEVNKFAKECIKTVLDAANGSFQVRVQELMQRLDREGSPVAPRLLGRSTFRSQQHYTGVMKTQQDLQDHL
ncbi:unnamed protein product [Durusdinium trenchii]|uniref:Tyrosine-protein kinase ephrin type A/B receptor-like domain-containing protein n=2 Tax=Durusdinium trenchii TaxID=1381693 RepID=A0ABP0L619_9DINO